MPEQIQERRITDKLTVRWGYSDARVEVTWKAGYIIPAATFTIEAKDLLLVKEIFEAAEAHAEKTKGAK